MFNSGAEYDIPLGEPKGIYGPVTHNGTPLTGWRMRTGLTATETLDRWDEPGPADAAWEAASPDRQTGPRWFRIRFRLPHGVHGAMRLDLTHAGKGSVWLNGWNLGRYWHLGPQRSLWLPHSRLQAENTVHVYEELHLTPSLLRLEFKAFGYQAKLTLPR